MAEKENSEASETIKGATRTSKRKLTRDPIPRRTRQRSEIVINLDDMGNPDDGSDQFGSPKGVWSTKMPSDAVAQVTFAEFRSCIESEMLGVKTKICEEIASSIREVNEKTAENGKKIAELDAGMETMGNNIKVIKEATAPAALRQEITNIIHREKLNSASSPTSEPDDLFFSVPGEQFAFDKKYWWARRCLRMWPINAGEDKLLEVVGDFLHNALGMEVGEVVETDVETIRKLKSMAKSRIVNEVLVVFKSTSIRDAVARCAPKLASAQDIGGVRPGIRMEIPQPLMTKFKMMEKHGHSLRNKHGKDLKRHIKFNDDDKSLVLEVKLPGEESWIRLSAETVMSFKKESEKKQVAKFCSKLSVTDDKVGPRPRPQNSASLATGANAREIQSSSRTQTRNMGWGSSMEQ